jgi:RNA polymerase sigma-70 factor (ECF subfamily)
VNARPRAFGSRSRPSALLDHSAFEDLYFRLSQRLLVFLTRRTADPEIAADLWSEAWARAFSSRDRYRGSSPEEEEAWVFGIARNVLSGYYKRGGAEQRALARLGLERPRLDPSDIDRLERLAGLGELRDALADALARLPEGQREALRLRVVHELPYDQVASRLSLSEQTARARVSRALRALGNLLDGEAANLDVPGAG